MHERSSTLILVPALLIALTVSPSFAYSFCDASLYGNPSLTDCSKLLFDDRNLGRGTRGLESLDRHPHLFYTEDLDQRPFDATKTQWWNKVRLAKTLSSGQYCFRVRLTGTDPMIKRSNIDSCSIFLALGFSADGKMYQYDTGTYHRIARQASGVLNDCAHYPESGDSFATMQGGQGWTGETIVILH